MRLNTPCQSIGFSTQDIYGKKIDLNDYTNKSVLLCFFRDTARPLRNRRVFELTRNYKAWKKVGVEVIVVFSDSQEEVIHFFKKHPRPFPVIADPSLSIYSKYGIERVIMSSFRSRVFKVPKWIDNFFRGDRAKYSPAGRIMPADFLIDFQGRVVQSWYGEHELDHIPLEYIERFVKSMRVEMRKKVLTEASSI